MRIYKRLASDEEISINELLALGGGDIPNNSAGNKTAELKAGTAQFRSGLRHPADTLAAHEQHEISVVLSGSFVLHGEDGDIHCEVGDVIHIPAGEVHASTAVGDSAVFYVLFG